MNPQSSVKTPKRYLASRRRVALIAVDLLIGLGLLLGAVLSSSITNLPEDCTGGICGCL